MFLQPLYQGKKGGDKKFNKFIDSEKEYTPAELASKAGLDLNQYYSETDAGTSKQITSNAIEVPDLKNQVER